MKTSLVCHNNIVICHERTSRMTGKKSVAIITSGYFPVPAVLGGAVEALDENLVRQNEIEKRLDLVVYSCFNADAAKKAEKYQSTKFEFVKIPAIVLSADKIVYFIAKNILHKRKSLSYRYIIQRLYYINYVANDLSRRNYNKVVIENHATLFMALKRKKNYKKYKGKYYYHLHNIVINDYGCKDIIASCKKVIGVSDYINKTLKNFLGEKDKNTYCVLKNKIDRDKFVVDLSNEEMHQIRNEFGIEDKDIVVLFSGRFDPEKGIKELLLAFKNVKCKNIKLLIVGGYYFGSGMESPFEREMYELAYHMKERVVFTGFIPYSKMPMLYAIADIVVIPSIWDDPAPLTVIESLTSGKALITTDSGGIPEYADPKSSIILSRNEHLVSSITEAIEKLANDKNLRCKMEIAAKEKTKKWTIESFYKDFCEFIEN